AIPGLNIALDFVLAIDFGLSAIDAALSVGKALKNAGAANSVVQMEHAAAALATVLVGTAAEIAMWAATWGVMKGAKAVAKWKKVDSFFNRYGKTKETEGVVREAKGDADEAEKLLKRKRQAEEQKRQLEEAEQKRKAAEAERQRKQEEEA